MILIKHFRVRPICKTDCIWFSLSDRRSTPRHSIMTRSKKVTEETTDSTCTLAILKNVRSPNVIPEETKENKKQSPNPPAKPAPPIEPKVESKFNIFPRSSHQLPCAQYKSEKGYKCPNCQRCYNARKNLVRHITLECGREPQYKCPYCSYSKHRRNELKKHIEKKHPNQRQQSPLGEKWTRTSAVLSQILL